MTVKSVKQRFEEAVTAAICRHAKHPNQLQIAEVLLSQYASELVEVIEREVSDENSEFFRGYNAGLEAARILIDQTGVYKIPFVRGDRVVANQNAGFHKGAHGVVEFVEPSGKKVWVLRDHATTPVYYHPDELDFE